MKKIIQDKPLLTDEEIIKVIKEAKTLLWKQYNECTKLSMCFALKDSIYMCFYKKGIYKSITDIKKYIPEFSHKNCRPIMYILLSVFVRPFSKVFPCFWKLKKYGEDSCFYWYPQTQKGYLKREKFLDKLIKLYSI